MAEASWPAVNSWCNACYRETAHDVRACDEESIKNEGHFLVTKSVASIRCRGCGEWSIRRQTLRCIAGEPSEPAEVEFWLDPPRTWRRPPEWLERLDSLAPDVAALLHEVYQSANDRQPRLLSMGVRAVLDIVMIQIVGDVGTFEKKMDAMREEGYLSPRQQDMLATVIDAGSAASHRGFLPARDLLQEMIVVMESIVRDHFITNPMLSTLKTLIPPRPPRRISRPPNDPTGAGLD